jgi:hypothetical protein
MFTTGPGGGDGYAASGLLHRSMDGAAGLLAAFSGGTGDGYDRNGIESKAIDPDAALLVIFTGGTGDGYDDDGFRNASLGGPSVPQEVFAGGEGDGYDTSGARHLSVDPGPMVLAAFLGSPAGGDGYDDEGAAFLALDGGLLTEFAFRGATGDGYGTDGLLFAPLTPSPLPPALVFAGGDGDGYDSESLPFVQYLGGGEAASGITFAGWLHSRFSEDERADGLADPAEDPDHDGLATLVEFALGSDPREPDALAFSPQFRLSNLSDLGYPALEDRYLTAIVRRNSLALDATLRVEVTDDTSSFWGINETVPVDSAPSLFIVRDELGVRDAPRRIMRLRATLNP